MNNNYGICNLEGCNNTTIGAEYCHYHTTITERYCAYQYHKKLHTAFVDWCSKKNKRFKKNCDNGCKYYIEPIEGIEIIEDNLNLNQGSG